MRVLIIEDDVAVLQALTMVLEQEGYAVGTALNGEEALRTIDTDPPDLILLDLWMPVMNGWQFLDRLRHPQHPHRRVPVIALSADVGARRRPLPIELFLNKPMDVEKLLTAVRRFLRPDDLLVPCL
jgi:two-component system, chemotaxis family, chemotaxis protein CheY